MIVISYVELVLMCLGIGVLWIIGFLAMLHTLDKWGLIGKDD
jgi:hypothetical protein